MIGVLSQFATDNYTPSLPSIAASLHTNNALIKLSIGIYFLSMGISQIFYGILGDIYGRKPLILFGLIIFLLSSFVVSISSTAECFIFARLLQGIGMGAPVALYRAILRDISFGKQFAKFCSYLMMFISVAPIIAPITGGYIQAFWGWRANFFLLVILASIVSFFVKCWLPETLITNKIRDFSAFNVIGIYRKLLSNKIFIICALASSLALSARIIYIIISAFLFQNILHVTPVVYGWLIFLAALMPIFSGALNAQLVEKMGVNKMLIIGGIIMLCGSLILLFYGLTFKLSVSVILLPVMLVLFGASIVFVNFTALAFSHISKFAGTAGSFYSGIQIIILSLATILVAYIPNNNQMPMTILILFCSILIVLSIFMIMKMTARHSVLDENFDKKARKNLYLLDGKC
jgi:Bcr/CflA subfamily drug resistance transporter